jgi:hypothetical protein
MRPSATSQGAPGSASWWASGFWNFEVPANLPGEELTTLAVPRKGARFPRPSVDMDGGTAALADDLATAEFLLDETDIALRGLLEYGSEVAIYGLSSVVLLERRRLNCRRATGE